STGEGRLVVVALDRTAQRQLEARVREREGLEAVGQVVAGVAHNFNNFLASILPVLDVVTPQVPERYRGLLEGARDSGARAAELVRQLMVFAGQRREEGRLSVHLGDLLTRAVARGE